MLYTILLGCAAVAAGGAFLLGVWVGRHSSAAETVAERPAGGQVTVGREEPAWWRRFLTYDGTTDEEASR